MLRSKRTFWWKVRRYDTHAKFFLVPYVSTVRWIFEVRHVQILNVPNRTAFFGCTDTKTVGSVASELKTLSRNVLAWYGTFIRLVRTLKQRTNVLYSYLHEKRVPYNCTVLCNKDRSVPYLHTVPNCHSWWPMNSDYTTAFFVATRQSKLL